MSVQGNFAQTPMIPQSQFVSIFVLIIMLHIIFCLLPYTYAFLPLNVVSNRDMTTRKSVHVGYGMEEVANDHDIFLLDMWGVMHDGSRPYDGVIDTVRKLKDAGKEIIILSNSSKRLGNSFKMLSKLGFDPNDFSQVITSGEVSTQVTY